MYFWDVYGVNMWEKISAEVRLTHAEQISLYNSIVLGKNNRHSWRLNKSSKKFWIIENLWVFRNWIRVNKFIFRTCNLTENELCSNGAFTLQFSDNFFNCRKVWFRVNDVNNYFVTLCIFLTISFWRQPIIFPSFFWNQNRLGFREILEVKLLDKQRETKESRRLNQTKTSYARKGIQIYLKMKKKRPKNTYNRGKNKVENKEWMKVKMSFFSFKLP